jgi:hypothetical protein
MKEGARSRMHNVDRGMISRFSCFVSLVLLIALNAILGGVLVVLTEVYNSSYPFALVMIYNLHGLAMGLFYLIFALEWRTLWQTEPHAYVQVSHELGKTFELSTRTIINTVGGLEHSRGMRNWFLMPVLAFVITFELAGFMARSGNSVVTDPVTATMYAMVALVYGHMHLLAMDTAAYPAGMDMIFAPGWSRKHTINESNKQV